MRSFLKKVSNFWNFVADHFFAFLKKYDWIILLVIITILAVAIRIPLFPKRTGDFNTFLNKWYTNFYNDGFKAMGVTVGDYTPAYNYFLWFLSLFRLEPGSDALVYGIKIISVVFDFVLAVYCGLIVFHVTNKNKIPSILTYALVLLGLTVFINSSLWGQCDAIYASFVVMSFYYFMKKHHRTSAIMLAIAFSFKLQTIFILPFYIVMFLRRKVNLKYLIWIPLVYITFAIPACIVADNFWTRFTDILGVYVNQSANSYKQLALNCSTLYSLIFTNFKEEQYISAFAVIFAIAVIGTFVFFIYRSKEEFDDRTLVKIFILFLMLTPFVLPHMHDRYYFIADAVLMVYVVLNPKKFYVGIIGIITSMIGYMVYLWNVPFINVVPQEQSDSTKALSFRFGAILYLIAICVIAYDLFKNIYPKDKNIELLPQREIENKEEDK